MEELINLLVGELVLAPEYLFVARSIVLVLCVDVVCALLCLIYPLATKFK